MNGAKLQKAITTSFEASYGKDIYIIKTMVTNKRGVPDLIGCLNGTLFGIEVKGKGDSPSELQTLNIKKITDAGGVGGFAYSVQDAYFILSLIKYIKDK